MAKQRCPHCAAELESPLACAACRRLFEVEESTSPFVVMGLETAFALEEPELKKRFLRLGRLVHPDFFGNESRELRELAERNSARLNRAYEVLADDFGRAGWLVSALGGPSEEDERSMPRAFLMEVLEWNELLEEARGSAPAAGIEERLAGLARALQGLRAETRHTLEGLLTPLPEHGSPRLRQVRQELNVSAYVDRALQELEALRLARASGR